MLSELDRAAQMRLEAIDTVAAQDEEDLQAAEASPKTELPEASVRQM